VALGIDMNTDMRVIAATGYFCAILFSGHPTSAQTTNLPPELEVICESLNLSNDKEVFAEWQKIEKVFKENGISEPGSFGSIMEVFFVPVEQADKARQIITQMIKDKKVDADKMQLKVREKEMPNHGLESTSAPPAAGTLETHP